MDHSLPFRVMHGGPIFGVAMVLLAGCSAVPTTLAETGAADLGDREPLAFELDRTIGTRHRVHMDVVELSPLDMTAQELGSAPGTGDLARLLELDLEGLRDPEIGLDACVTAVLDALGPVQPGMEQTLVAVQEASQGPAWFVERHASTIARADEIDWCQPHAPASLQARYQGPLEGGLVTGSSGAGASRCVTYEGRALWIPTVRDSLWPLPASLPSDSDDSLTGATHRAVIEQIDDGNGQPTTISVCFERHGEAWLPALYWDSDPDGWTRGCSIKYADAPGLGWRPAVATQFSWESHDGASDVLVARTTFTDWAEIPNRPDAASSTVAHDYETWPEEVQAFFPCILKRAAPR